MIKSKEKDEKAKLYDICGVPVIVSDDTDLLEKKVVGGKIFNINGVPVILPDINNIKVENKEPEEHKESWFVNGDLPIIIFFVLAIGWIILIIYLKSQGYRVFG